MTDEMKIEGEEVCDENGVCYAYSGATGTSLIPYSGDSEIYYQVIFSDGNKTSSRTDVLVFVGAEGTPPSEGGDLPIMMIGIGALVLAALLDSFIGLESQHLDKQNCKIYPLYFA